MLRAWAPSYNDIPNQLAESAGITTQGMISYFLFWIIQLPLLLIHPTKLRPLFWVKLFAAPVAAIATMGWCINRAGGGGDMFALRATASGPQYAWLWLTCMSSVSGQWSTLAVNGTYHRRSPIFQTILTFLCLLVRKLLPSALLAIMMPI